MKINKNNLEYIAVPKAILKDRTVSLRAKAVFFYLIGVSETTNYKKISADMLESLHTIKKTIEELKMAGYIKQDKTSIILVTDKQPDIPDMPDNEPEEEKEEDDFSFDTMIKALEDSDQRHLNIIALFCEKRKDVIRQKILNHNQRKIFLRRHVKSASALKHYTNEQLIDAFNAVEEKYKDIDWTLETVLKELTK
jgi:DNA-binding transcriptional regulator YhcF (GntR family)